MSIVQLIKEAFNILVTNVFGLFAFPYGFEHIVDDFRRNSFGPTRSQSPFISQFESGFEAVSQLEYYESELSFLPLYRIV